MRSLFAFVFALVLCSSFASAEDVFREPAYRDDADAYLYNFPYWIEANQSTALYVTNPNPLTSYATLSLNGSSANMTLLSSGRFRSYVSSATEEDVAFSVSFYDASATLLSTINDTLRFRVPFDLEFSFFKSNNATTGEIEPYDDEFQYAVLEYRPEGSYSYTLDSGSSLSWLNSIGRLFPYYKDIGSSDDDLRVTDSVYLWARLEDGVASVQVYENGTYALSTMSTKVYGGLSALYEFGRPISNDAIPYRLTNAGDLDVNVEGDASYNVYVSAWEVYKKQLFGGLLKIAGVLMLWGLLCVGLAFLLTGWLPLDLRERAFGAVLGTIVLVTSPLLVFGVRLVW